MNHQELEKVTGGASPWVVLGIAAIAVFISGIIEGVVHPKACNS